MKFEKDFIYRAYVLMRRMPHIFKKVCFLPLKSDHHVVWDVHEKYLQYQTAPVIPGKILHVINRLPTNLAKYNFNYFSELENIFSLLPREVLKSKNYQDTKNELKKIMKSDNLRGVIFQSEGALKVNQPWLDYNTNLKYDLVTVVPAQLESRPIAGYFVNKNNVKFLIFASRFYEKGLHIFLAVAKRLENSKKHYKFTLVTPYEINYGLPANVENIVMPRPSLEERRELYTGHDYIMNLSLGDSLGVFLDSVRFSTPMIGYYGQHGKTYCSDKTSIMLDNPIFVYGDKFLVEYNMFEYEEYLENLENSGFFEKDKNNLLDILIEVDKLDKYKELVASLNVFSRQFSTDNWLNKIKKVYHNYSTI